MQESRWRWIWREPGGHWKSLNSRWQLNEFGIKLPLPPHLHWNNNLLTSPGSNFSAVPSCARAWALVFHGLCLRMWCLLLKFYSKFCSQASLNLRCGRSASIYGCFAGFPWKFLPEGMEGKRAGGMCRRACESDLEMCQHTGTHYHLLLTGGRGVKQCLQGQAKGCSQSMSRAATSEPFLLGSALLCISCATHSLLFHVEYQLLLLQDVFMWTECNLQWKQNRDTPSSSFPTPEYWEGLVLYQ